MSHGKAKRLICSMVAAAVVILPAAGPAYSAPKPKMVKVEICHKPGTDAEGTRKVAQKAVKAHIAHGDHEGACVVAPVEPTV